MKPSYVNTFYKYQIDIYDATRKHSLPNREMAIKHLELINTDTVADYCCGTGLNTPYLNTLVPYNNIIGIDISEAMLSKYKALYPLTNQLNTSLTDNFMLPDKVNKAICSFGITMIEDYEIAIKHIKQNLKDNGIFIIHDFSPITKWYLLPWKWIGKLMGIHKDRDYTASLKRYFNVVEVYNYGYTSVWKAS